MTKIKICGLMTSQDIAAVNRAQADLAGFIFAKGRHQIDLTTALKLRQRLDPTIPSVGVFVNAPLTEMIQAFDSGAISIIQLHGQEDETVVKALQERQIPVIQVFKPTSKPQTNANYLMFDSGAGNGTLVDWKKSSVKSKQPLIIAGALDITNVQAAIKTIKPAYVDLSRGVETDGHKDPKKVSEIVSLVHQL